MSESVTRAMSCRKDAERLIFALGVLDVFLDTVQQFLHVLVAGEALDAFVSIQLLNHARVLGDKLGRLKRVFLAPL